MRPSSRTATALAHGVRVAVTDRHGGTGGSGNLAAGHDPTTTRRNRRATALDLGLDPDRVVLMRQVHGAEVRYVTAPFGADAPALDAVFTDRPGLALGVLVADCAPVLIADAAAGLVGAAHSGRAGTAAGVVPALVRAMTDRGARAARMAALVGPAACGRCYEVSAEIRDAVVAAVPAAGARSSRGLPALDLRAAITAQLAAHGVTDVRHDDRCTIESADLFSHRREQPTGRFGAYVWLDS